MEFTCLFGTKICLQKNYIWDKIGKEFNFEGHETITLHHINKFKWQTKQVVAKSSTYRGVMCLWQASDIITFIGLTIIMV